MRRVCTISFCGDAENGSGLPGPFFHYAVIARENKTTNTATAEVFSLSEAQATGTAQKPFHEIRVQGDVDAALREAEDYLDKQHIGLEKIVGRRQTR
jgi:hypothetical protein